MFRAIFSRIIRSITTVFTASGIIHVCGCRVVLELTEVSSNTSQLRYELELTEVSSNSTLIPAGSHIRE
jgi:hypothetical protein